MARKVLWSLRRGAVLARSDRILAEYRAPDRLVLELGERAILAEDDRCPDCALDSASASALRGAAISVFGEIPDGRERHQMGGVFARVVRLPGSWAPSPLDGATRAG